ncbi:MAG: NUDIX hydrolase [Actinomycetota bacterium]|nr:NUDIX hydrolase [Actinomycetota bacterium]
MTGDGSFRKIGEREVHRGYATRVVVSTFVGPGGEEFTRDVVHAPGAVAVVPIVGPPGEERVVLVEQFRAPLEAPLLEIPAGLRDKEGEPTDETARRELAEEAGYSAGSLELLSTFHNAAGMTDQKTWVYLATDLTPTASAADGVEEDYLEVVEIPLADVPARLASGEVSDAKTVIGLCLTLRRLGR